MRSFSTSGHQDPTLSADAQVRIHLVACHKHVPVRRSDCASTGSATELLILMLGADIGVREAKLIGVGAAIQVPIDAEIPQALVG
jgi:hypothetical protein